MAEILSPDGPTLEDFFAMPIEEAQKLPEDVLRRLAGENNKATDGETDSSLRRVTRSGPPSWEEIAQNLRKPVAPIFREDGDMEKQVASIRHVASGIAAAVSHQVRFNYYKREITICCLPPQVSPEQLSVIVRFRLAFREYNIGFKAEI